MGEPLENGFYLAVVGDHDEAEPIRIQDGHWYSIGCADPHDLGSIEIIRLIDLSIPTRAQREEQAKYAAEQAAWQASVAALRERNYEAYRRKFYQRYGRYPGHRRWPSPSPHQPGGVKR